MIIEPVKVILYFYIVGFFVVGIMNVFMIDEIIKYQFLTHRDKWERDGKPRGLFFNPENSSYISFNIVSVKLYFTKPSWIIEDERAIKLYIRFKFWTKLGKYFALSLIPSVIIFVELLR